MCGIAGVWTGRADAPLRREVVTAMLGAMAGRGPDGIRLVERDGLTVGFNLLAIVGGPDNRAQPVEDGALVAGLNGEIYNYPALARQYGLDPEALASDALVLPALWRSEGSPRRLDGMFAGFVFDEDQRRLVLFRDHLGIKPLFTARVGSALVFGSTLCAVAAAAGRDQVDVGALEHYLRRGYPAADPPLVAGVDSVRAGTTVTYDAPDGTPRVHQWFDVRDAGRSPSRTFDLATFTESVLEEVPERMPITVALSGGVDSTSLALILMAAGKEPLTLSVQYDAEDDRTRQDESVVSRLVADFGLSHTEVHISRRDALSEVEGPWRFDVPIADPNAIPLSRLARTTRDFGSRVLMTGDGADELFAGYDYHVAASRPFPLGVAQARLGGRMEEPADRRFARRLTGRRRPRRIAPGGTDPVTAVRLDDLGGWLEPNLLTKGDRFAMAESVELRVPYLRPWLVHAAFAINPRQLVADGQGKQPLRQVVSPLVPNYVLTRRKVGFSAPLDAWLSALATQELAEHVTESLAGLLDLAELQRVWRDHASGARAQAQQLWRLAVLRSWLEGMTQTRRQVPRLDRAQPSDSGVEPE